MLFVDLDLARRLEMAHAWRGVQYARAQHALHPDIQIRVEQVAGGYVVYAGADSPLNRAIGLGLHGPVTHADIESVEQFYHRCGAFPRLDFCPLADQSLLNLLKLGAYRLERFYNVLICSLTEDIAAVALPAEVRITQADRKQAELWVNTVAQGFSDQEPPTRETLDMMAPNFFSTNGTCFFAWVDGSPAGGGAMYVHEGIAEFGGTSTRPAFRRRGVQTALLQARLEAAREQGCTFAMVVTSPGSASQRNVERAGFRLAYTKTMLARYYSAPPLR